MRNRLLLPTLLLLTACSTVRGSGKLATRDADALPSFHGIEVGHGIEARVRPGPQHVRVSGDDNLVAMLELEVRDGILHVEFPDRVSVWGDHDLELEVTMPQVEHVGASGGAEVDAHATRCADFRVEASGGAEVRVAGVDADRLVLDASGGAEVTLLGRADDMDADLSGAASLQARELEVGRLAVDVSGASEIEAFVHHEVSGDASGASSVHVRGRPRVANVDTSGASDFEIDN